MQWISVVHIQGAVTLFRGPIIICQLPWYSFLISGAPLWPVVGNKHWWRTLDGCKSILRNNDTHRGSQWGPLMFIGGQQVPLLTSIEVQWLSLELASVSSSGHITYWRRWARCWISTFAVRFCWPNHLKCESGRDLIMFENDSEVGRCGSSSPHPLVLPGGLSLLFHPYGVSNRNLPLHRLNLCQCVAGFI